MTPTQEQALKEISKEIDQRKIIRWGKIIFTVRDGDTTFADLNETYEIKKGRNPK